MRTRKAWLAAVAGWLLFSATACHKKNTAEQLAALESAYQSGVLTKDEYEAKKAAIVGAAPAPAAAPALAPPAPPPAEPAAPKPVPGAREAPAPPAPAPMRPAVPPAAESAPRNARAEPAAQGRGSDASEEEPAPKAGCEDAEYKSGKEKGPQERFFPAPLSRVKKTAAAALATLDFTIHKNAGDEIEASKKRHFGVVIGKGGERVILHFAEVQQGSQRGTRVTGETRKSVIGRLAQKSWTNAVLAQTACMLRSESRR